MEWITFGERGRDDGSALCVMRNDRRPTTDDRSKNLGVFASWRFLIVSCRLPAANEDTRAASAVILPRLVDYEGSGQLCREALGRLEVFCADRFAGENEGVLPGGSVNGGYQGGMKAGGSQ